MATATLDTGCSIKPTISQKPRHVSVNGVAIPRAAIARETQNHPAAKPIEAWQRAARALVIRELLLQEARRLAIAPEPADLGEGRRETDDEALVRQLVEQAVQVPEADEATCRRYYERNIGRFRSPDLHEVAHILIRPARMRRRWRAPCCSGWRRSQPPSRPSPPRIRPAPRAGSAAASARSAPARPCPSSRPLSPRCPWAASRPSP